MDNSPTSLFDSYEGDFQQLISGIKVKLEVEAGEQKGGERSWSKLVTADAEMRDVTGFRAEEGYTTKS
ncbi:hypothetical protein FRC03_008297 [Tulasnella sp. 419]|nr:hypothetical protein FRC03_008297 [Tulasnella sp. 419]